MPESREAHTIAVQPVVATRRIAAIDVARGIALLGIFCVNIHYMGEPSGTYFDATPPASADTLSQAAWYFYKTFCEGKFYPLFATLFGAGLALQFANASDRETRRGKPSLPWSIWWAHPIRRLFALLLIGLAHALLVWFGDILVVYALLGFVMLLLVRLSVRGLIISAGVLAVLTACLLLLGAVMVAVFGHSRGPQTVHPPATAQAQASAPESSALQGQSDSTVDPSAQAPKFEIDDRPPLEQILEGFSTGRLTGPWDKPYRELETRALRDGPFAQLAGVRAVGWGMAVVFTLFGGNTLILALFCLGAILVKANLLHPRHDALHRRISLFGLLAGVPIAVITVMAKAHHETQVWAALVYGFGLSFGGPLLTMGYLFTIVRWTHSGSAPLLLRLFADAGRMALTTYLLCSILGTGVFYYWGLGWFGQTTVIERFLILVPVFALIVAFARLWLSAFAFGPAEWIWRTFTYLRPQPIRKAAASAE